MGFDGYASCECTDETYIHFYERKWFSAREQREDGNFYWTSHYSDTLVSKADVTSDPRGQAIAKFTPTAGGIYRIVGEGKDARGNSVRSATYQWVASSGFVNWRGNGMVSCSHGPYVGYLSAGNRPPAAGRLQTRRK